LSELFYAIGLLCSNIVAVIRIRAYVSSYTGTRSLGLVLGFFVGFCAFSRGCYELGCCNLSVSLQLIAKTRLRDDLLGLRVEWDAKLC